MIITKPVGTPRSITVYEESDVKVCQFGANDFYLSIEDRRISDFYPTHDQATSHIAERLAVYNELINHPVIAAQLSVVDQFIDVYNRKSSVGQHTGEWREGYINGLNFARNLILWGAAGPFNKEPDDDTVVTTDEN